MVRQFFRSLWQSWRSASLQRRLQDYQLERVKRRHQKKLEKTQRISKRKHA